MADPTDDDRETALVENEETEEQAAERKKKKKSEGEGAAGRGREKPVVSEAAQQLMRERGFSIQQITDLLKNWRYLDTKEVAVRLAEFGSSAMKASAHIVVSFADKGYAAVSVFLKHVTHLGALTRKLASDNTRRGPEKNDINLG